MRTAPLAEWLSTTGDHKIRPPSGARFPEQENTKKSDKRRHLPLESHPSSNARKPLNSDIYPSLRFS
jgi:hypothetical protein